MLTKKNKFVEIGPRIWQYDTGIEGPEGTVAAGVHGNERIGIEAIRHVMQGDMNLPLRRGKATFIEGNPDAVDQDVRSIDSNLNREILIYPTEEEQERQQRQRSFKEVRRSKVIIPHLIRSAALLDLHGFRQMDGIPFIITTPRGFETAAAIGAPIISSNWNVIERGGTDSGMEELGKIGICHELGQLRDLENGLPRARISMHNFFHTLGMIERPLEHTFNNPTYIEAQAAMLAQEDFEWGPKEQDLPFKSWQKLESGLLIARNGGKEIRAQEGQHIIFPSDDLHPQLGSEVFNLGIELEPPKHKTV